MNQSISVISGKLRAAAVSYSALDVTEKRRLLRLYASKKLIIQPAIEDYADTLLFVAAYADDPETLQLAMLCMEKLTDFLRKSKALVAEKLANTGLPFAPAESKFSHDFLCWMNSRRDLKLEITEIRETSLKLIDALRVTLPASEREHTLAGYDYPELLDALKVKEKNALDFLLDQFSTLNEQPLTKDLVFDALDIYVKATPTVGTISRLYNRLNLSEHFYHSEILKRFDHVALLNSPLPEPIVFSEIGRQQCADVVKESMLHTVRETDPATFMDVQSLRLYELERGISVAIYGMTSARQLTYESYVGYTLFKNGYPASYGGGWLFGRRSLFGINIYEPFRGGESGYIMCQLLRVYRQAFGADYFEVEPYQYGADNPDGISSGAFWFYYRYGFRPLDKTLKVLADKEAAKIASTKGYRSSEKTLIRFTEGNIALNLSKGIPMTVSQITGKVTAMIASRFNGNRGKAVEECRSRFASNVGGVVVINDSESRVFTEIALFAEAFKISRQDQYELLIEMITAKPIDVYHYQKLWVDFFQLSGLNR